MSIENNVTLIGNLGNDPETRYTQGGMAITRISLATTSRRKDKDGNQREETQWHRVVFFGKLAEIAGEYLKKGSKCAVMGSIRYDKYDKPDGTTVYTTDIIADQLQMLSSRNEGGGQREAPQRRTGDTGYGRQQPSSNQPQQSPPVDDFADDDIPF